MKQVIVLFTILNDFVTQITSAESRLPETDVATNCSSYPEDEIVQRLFVSGRALVKLRCDTTHSFDQAFEWEYSPDGDTYGDVLYTPDGKSNKYTREGQSFKSSLILGENPDTGFYCCHTYEKMGTFDYRSFVSEIYAVLMLPENFQIPLTASPGGLVEEGTTVTLDCSLPPGSTLGDIIAPQVFWILPETLPQPSSSNLTQYKYVAYEDLNGKEFYCEYWYYLTRSRHQFRSNAVMASVTDEIVTNATTEFFEVNSTVNSTDSPENKYTENPENKELTDQPDQDKNVSLGIPDLTDGTSTTSHGNLLTDDEVTDEAWSTTETKTEESDEIDKIGTDVSEKEDVDKSEKKSTPAMKQTAAGRYLSPSMSAIFVPLSATALLWFL